MAVGLEGELKKLGSTHLDQAGLNKGMEAGALGPGCTDRSTTCSQDGALLTPAKLESYLYSI